jgi:hypothetical protein
MRRDLSGALAERKTYGIARRSFGYKDMEYFKLKIMQIAGYLTSRYFPNNRFDRFLRRSHQDQFRWAMIFWGGCSNLQVTRFF